MSKVHQSKYFAEINKKPMNKFARFESSQIISQQIKDKKIAVSSEGNAIRFLVLKMTESALSYMVVHYF